MIPTLPLPVVLTAPAGDVLLRGASPDDLDAIVALMADDEVSRSRGDVAAQEDLPAYAEALRLLVEAVRVSSTLRSSGIGSALMEWVTHAAVGATGAGLVQLTSDAARTDAHRFYERLGFVGSHVGFKYRPDAAGASGRRCDVDAAEAGTGPVGGTSAERA